jgi:hypothetical protein
MMRCRLFAGALLISVVGDAGAQSLGTFRWQLQPYCNVVTVAITRTAPSIASKAPTTSAAAAATRRR